MAYTKDLNDTEKPKNLYSHHAAYVRFSQPDAMIATTIRVGALEIGLTTEEMKKLLALSQTGNLPLEKEILL
jgi:hypothetical protein